MNEWLENLKVGDTVVESVGGYCCDPLRMMKVVKITKTQIHVERKSDKLVKKFSKNTGSSLGSSHYNTSFLREYTEEMKERIIRQNAINIVQSVEKWELEKSTTEQLIKAAHAISEIKNINMEIYFQKINMW